MTAKIITALAVAGAWGLYKLYQACAAITMAEDIMREVAE